MNLPIIDLMRLCAEAAEPGSKYEDTMRKAIVELEATRARLEEANAKVHTLSAQLNVINRRTPLVACERAALMKAIEIGKADGGLLLVMPAERLDRLMDKLEGGRREHRP
jgi:hypothetical protein